MKLEVLADVEKLGVTSPTALAFGENGRVYIAESHRYKQGVEDDRENLFWYLDDLASRTVDDRRTLHEKWKAKVPLEKLRENAELIRVLEDKDGDGKPDDSKVFAGGFNDVLDGTASGIFAYENEIYFACIPKLTALRDTDGDGTADKTFTVADGFGVHISLSGHDLNGFALGPDGRIWGTVGDRGFKVTTREGNTYDYPDQGAVFRFDPDGTNFEVVHTGLRNPKEIAFNDLGDAFTVDNNSDQGDKARVVYIAEGADSGWEIQHQALATFHRQIGMEKKPPSRWMNENLWHTAEDGQPAYVLPPVAYLTSGPSGLTYHPGTGFLESEAGRFLVCDYRGGAANSAVWSFAMKPQGAGMMLADSRKLLTGIAVSDVDYSWDGRVFLTDFGGGWQSNPNGGLYSLSAAQRWRTTDADGVAKLMKDGFNQRPSAELAVLLKHPDLRVRLRAQLALTRKKDAFEKLAKAAESGDPTTRIHGIRGLGILARRGPAAGPPAEFGAIPGSLARMTSEVALMRLLESKDEETRVQCLKALLDSSVKGAAPLEIAPLFDDPSPRVVYHATLLAGKRRMTGLYGDICTMLEKNAGKDRYLFHAGAYALSMMAEDKRFLSSLSQNPSSHVRLAAVVAMRRQKDSGLSLFVRDENAEVANEAIRAACDLDIPNARRAATALLDKEDAAKRFTPFMQRRLIHAAFRSGDPADLSRIFAIAANESFPDETRVETIRLLAQWKKPFPVNQFTGHWSPLPERDVKPFAEALVQWSPKLLAGRGIALGPVLDLLHNEAPDLAAAELLEKLATDASIPSSSRAAAVAFLAARHPEKLVSLMESLSADAADDVALPALESWISRLPDNSLPAVTRILSSERVALAQSVIRLLGKRTEPGYDALLVSQLDSLAKQAGKSPLACEVLAWAAVRKDNPAVSSALAAYEASVKSSSDPLAAWFPALQGGDPARGKALFDSNPASECYRCHRADGGHNEGGDTAPELSGVALRHADPRDFLESLLRPNAVVAPGFGTVSITFKNGANLGGVLIEKTDDSLIIDSNGKRLRIATADAASITDPVSAMPPMEALKPEEIRDLVAWLGSLKTPDAEPPPAIEAQSFDPATLVATTSAVEKPATATLMAKGKTQFITCAACHGQNGEGTAAAPPLAGSEWIAGDAATLIRIQLRGLRGPITVKGVTHEYPAGMAPLAYQSDEQIAAVLTYVRASFGNTAPPVSPAEVKTLRSEVGKPQLTTTELHPPVAAPSPPADHSKYAGLEVETSSTKWWIIPAGIAAVVALGFLMKKKE